MSIDRTTTVAELVVDRPSRARLFEKLGLDYCCGGKRSLAEACAERGLDLDTVIAVLEADDGAAEGEAEDWSRAPIGGLLDHIAGEHHALLRRELPRLSALLEKVERAHAGEQPELRETRAVFEDLRGELEAHMEKEEQVLFPACRRVEAGLPAPPYVASAISVMEAEHARAGSALERLRELTGGYDLSRALCNTHRATVDGLRELELDLHQHIHEENNILFPRVEEMLAAQ